jgi:DNA-binding transcriptional LysR family regulator
MLDVKRLRVLREVAARGSFSAAAESLAYTQSAVSQQIAALEREAGTVLVDRNARGVRMTEAGRALVRHAEVILARLADAEAELEAIAGVRGGRLRMVSFPTAGATLAPRAIGRFRERYPGVEVTLEPRDPPESEQCLKAGECDIALTLEAGFEPIDDKAIVRHHLLDDPMYVCLPAGHPAAARREIRLADLAQDTWITSVPGTCPDARILERACQAAGFEPRVAFQSDDYVAIQGFIAAGVGVCLIPDLALVAVRDDVVVRPLQGRPPWRHIVAATLAGGFVSAAAAAMLEILAEVGAEFEATNRSLALAS